mmetsp:Transcript_18649/g.16893  ORF Transcript_18649/g.16893 Transcript_18649/m.16893 type:complete len:631 (-) Transcript_18649:26-1918(-)
MSDITSNMNRLREAGYWGIGLSIVGSLFLSSGLCLQKLVQKNQDTDRRTNNSSINPSISSTNGSNLNNNKIFSYRIAGMTYVTLGVLIQCFVDVLLPLSTIAPLSAQTIIYTTILEFIFLDGELTRFTMICLSLIVFGIITCVNGSIYMDGFYSLPTLISIFTVKYKIIIVLLSIGVLVTLREIGKSRSYSNNSVIYTNRRGLLYLAFSAALFSAYFNTLLKGLLEITKYSVLTNYRSFFSPGLVFLLIGLLVIGLFKMLFVSYALNDFHHMRFLPCYHSLAILFTSLCGLLFYEEFSYDRSKYFTLTTKPTNKPINYLPSQQINLYSFLRLSNRRLQEEVVDDDIPFLDDDDNYYWIPPTDKLLYAIGLSMIVVGVFMMVYRYDASKYVTVSADYLEESFGLLSDETSNRDIVIVNQSDKNYYMNHSDYKKTPTTLSSTQMISTTNKKIDKKITAKSYGSTEKTNESDSEVVIERSQRRAALIDYGRGSNYASNQQNSTTNNPTSNPNNNITTITTNKHRYTNQNNAPIDISNSLLNTMTSSLFSKNANRITSSSTSNPSNNTFSGVAREGTGIEEDFIMKSSKKSIGLSPSVSSQSFHQLIVESEHEKSNIINDTDSLVNSDDDDETI